MLKENEVVMLILGVGVLFFIILNKVHLKKINSWRLLVLGYCVLLSGWFFTVLEEFFFEIYLNHLEHICYLVSSVLLIIWCRRYVGMAREGGAS